MSGEWLIARYGIPEVVKNMRAKTQRRKEFFLSAFAFARNLPGQAIFNYAFPVAFDRFVFFSRPAACTGAGARRATTSRGVSK